MSIRKLVRALVAVVVLLGGTVALSAPPASALPSGPCTFGWSVPPFVLPSTLAGSTALYFLGAAISVGPDCVTLAINVAAVPATGTPTTCASQPAVTHSIVAQQFANCFDGYGVAVVGTTVQLTYSIQGVGTNGSVLTIVRTCAVTLQSLNSSSCT